MFSKIKKLVIKTHFFFILDKNERQFIRFCKNKWGRRSRSKTNGEILVDVIGFHPYIFQTAYTSNFLSGESGFSLKTVDTTYSPKFLFLKKYFYRFSKLRKLYHSFGCSDGLNYTNLSGKALDACEDEAVLLLQGVKTKADIVDLEFRNIKVGDLIYDTYLRSHNCETVDLEDNRLLSLVKSAVMIFYSCELYLNSHPVKKVILSHSVYIQYGILARLAVSKNIAVYMFSKWNTQVVHKLSESHDLHTTNHRQYKKKFRLLDDKKKRLDQAKAKLLQRLSGEIDPGISYVKRSAYNSNIEFSDNVMKQTGRLRVVIFLHCFYDSPHIYKTMLFPDFYEWLDFTLKVLEKTGFDIYVKPHPGGLAGNEQVVEEFSNKYPDVTFIDKYVLNNQLIGEGLDAAITVYGTLGHEFSYKGVPVITAGENPHSAYSFCNHATTTGEYVSLLSNADKLPKEISKAEIEQFYYMHYLNVGDGRLDGDNDIFNIGNIKERTDSLALLLKAEENGEFNDVDTFFRRALNQVDCLD